MKRRLRHGARAALGVLIAGALGLTVGPIAAQQAPLSGGTLGTESPAPRGEEGQIQIIEGPGGSAFRLVERAGDEQQGGGLVRLARWESPGDWKPLLEIAPKEPGLSALNASLAVSPAGQIAVSYRWRQHRPRSKQIRLALSSDNGKTWQLPTQPVDTAGQAFESRIGWGRDKTLVVAWDDERRNSRAFDIYARRSPDGGLTWEPEHVLSRFPSQGRTDISARPRMVSDGKDRFWVLWVGVARATNYLYLSRSQDGGRTWSEPISVGGNIQSVYGHTLQLVGDRLFVLWMAATEQGDRIWCASSSDGGASWTPPVHVQHLPSGQNIQVSSPALLLAPDGEALVAWHDSRNGRFDVYLARSTDGGRTWGSEDMRLDTDDAGTAHSRYPRFARGPDGRVIVTWEDDREGWEGVYARVRTGSTWGPEVRAVGPGVKKGARLPQPLWVGPRDVNLTWETWDYSGGATRITRQIDQRTLKIEDRPAQ